MIKLPMHLFIDSAVGVAMMLAPFWIGFRDDSPAMIFFVAYGIAMQFFTLFTGYESSPS